MEYWKGMTVRDCMNQLKGRNTRMFLGAYSAFYLIVTPAYLEEHEDEILTYVKNHLSRKLDEMRKALDELKDKDCTPVEVKMNGRYKRILVEDTEAERIRKQIKKLEELLNIVPFSERTVTGIFRRIDGTGYNILTDTKQGKHIGKFWDLPEWKAVHGEGIDLERFAYDMTPYWSREDVPIIPKRKRKSIS